MIKSLRINCSINKIALIVVGLVFFNAPGYSQAKEATKTFFGELVLGGAFPAGYFKLEDPGNSYSGHAQTGASIDLNAGYHIIETFGVLAKYNFSSYPINQQSMNQFYDKDLEDFLETYENSYGITSSNLSTNWYAAHGLMVGTFVKLPVFFISIDIRTMGGYYRMTRPKVEYAAEFEQEAQYVLEEQKEKGGGFFYGLEINMSYDLNPQLKLVGNLGYTRSEPDLENIHLVRTIEADNYEKSFQKSWNPQVESFSISLGVRYSLFSSGRF